MSEEKFNYEEFASDLSQQSKKNRVYIIEKIEVYSNHAGEAIYNDEDTNFNINEYKFLTQVITKWTFHESVDLIKGGIYGENRDYVLHKIAYTIFEFIKKCIKRGIE